MTQVAEKANIITRVHDCVKLLASQCDGAREDDGVGFNGVDASFGHSLARQNFLSQKQGLAAVKMIQKYRRQLGGDLPSIAEVEAYYNPPRKAVQEVRPTRWNNSRWATETYCCGHWWVGSTCLYGLHKLTA